ncbi:uncharacterized protein LOC121562705 [Coregonus clupeaformis]|uniref:uncharacterized protein LOC121562705 n=1 Tax=Coregonus clupeaformis TaxID=59861 RepID=UPI001E1C9351|nr:uncharacterized protein LOC121562705 [Coregonus clupeaformis]
MAEHAPGGPPIPLGHPPAPSTPLFPLFLSPPSVHLSIPFLRLFSRKTEFLSYLLLCLVKMPFIPPVPSSSSSISPSCFSIFSLSVTGTRTGITTTTSPPPLQVTPVRAGKAKAPLLPEGKTNVTGNSVREHLTVNGQLGRKSQPRSRLPTIRGRGAVSSGLWVEGRNPWLPSNRLPVTGHRLPVMSLPSGNGSTGGRSSFPASSSGESVTQGVELEEDLRASRMVPKTGSSEKLRASRMGTRTGSSEKLRASRMGTRTGSSEDLRASRMGTRTGSSEKLRASRMGTRQEE